MKNLERGETQVIRSFGGGMRLLARTISASRALTNSSHSAAAAAWRLV